MARTGRSLERLVACIERAVGCAQGAVVTSPKRLRDKITDRLREHDVVVEVPCGPRTLVTAIECRDRSRKVDVDQVEAFSRKCQDTGIDRGVIVSKRGFWETARKKATVLGIQCLDLDEALRFDWLLAQGMTVGSPVIESIQWRFLVPDWGESSGDHLEVLGPEGQPVEQGLLVGAAHDLVRRSLAGQLPSLGDEIKVAKFKVPVQGVTLRHFATGSVATPSSALLTVGYRIVGHFAPFSLTTYREDDSAIAEVATADVQFGESRGAIVLVNQPGHGTKVLLRVGPEDAANGD